MTNVEILTKVIGLLLIDVAFIEISHMIHTREIEAESGKIYLSVWVSSNLNIKEKYVKMRDYHNMGLEHKGENR